MILGSLWNHYRDEIDGVNDNASKGKSFKYKTKIIRKAPEQLLPPPQPPQPRVPTLNVKVTIPLKCLINFWRCIDLSLINCNTFIMGFS